MSTQNKITAKLVLTDKFKGQSIEIEKLKAPVHKTDAKGIPIMAGYLKFSYNEGDNSYIEYNVLCTQTIFQDIVSKKLWRQKNIKIKLIFDASGQVENYEVATNIPTESYFGFKINPDDLKELQRESENLDYTTQSPSSMPDCIIKILDKPNADGMLAEVKYMPTKAKKENMSEIITAVNSLVKKKKAIKAKDILIDKYLVTDIGNDGAYIYVNPVSFTL